VTFESRNCRLTSNDNILVTRSLKPELYDGPIGLHFPCITLDNNSVCDLAEAKGELGDVGDETDQPSVSFIIDE
jgi:hypothetical protein